jgi:hypothetical protein
MIPPTRVELINAKIETFFMVQLKENDGGIVALSFHENSRNQLQKKKFSHNKRECM